MGDGDCRSQEAWAVPAAPQFNVKQNYSIKKSINISTLWEEGGIVSFLKEQQLQISLMICPMSLKHRFYYMDTCDLSLRGVSLYPYYDEYEGAGIPVYYVCNTQT